MQGNCWRFSPILLVQQDQSVKGRPEDSSTFYLQGTYSQNILLRYRLKTRPLLLLLMLYCHIWSIFMEHIIAYSVIKDLMLMVVLYEKYVMLWVLKSDVLLSTFGRTYICGT